MERYIGILLAGAISLLGAAIGVSFCVKNWNTAEKTSGETGYYSSPHVTRPANIGGYTECPLVFKKKDGTYYAKVTVCHRA